MISHVEMGAGPAVLALHGGMGGIDQSLILARALFGDAPAFRVIAVSRPGYQGSPLGQAATPEAQADAYVWLLDQLGVERCLVVAVSAGGPSAIQFALRHPQRCAGLVLVSAATGRLETPQKMKSRMPAMKLVARLQWLTGMMRRKVERHPDRAAARSIPDPVLRRVTLDHAEAGPLLRALQTSLFDRLDLRLPGTLNDMSKLEIATAPDVSSLRAPLLAVHAMDDRIVPFEHGRSVAEGAPHGRLLALQTGDHVALFTHLDEVREAVRRFVAEIGWR